MQEETINELKDEIEKLRDEVVCISETSEKQKRELELTLENLSWDCT